MIHLVASDKGDARTISIAKCNLGPTGMPQSVRFIDDGPIDASWEVSERLLVEACAPPKQQAGNEAVAAVNKEVVASNRERMRRERVLAALGLEELPLTILATGVKGKLTDVRSVVEQMVADGTLEEREGERAGSRLIRRANGGAK